MYKPLFAQFQKSRYSEKLLLSINQTQTHNLTNRLDSDSKRMLEVRDTIELEESPQVLFHDNPLKSGFFMIGIQNGNNTYSLYQIL